MDNYKTYSAIGQLIIADLNEKYPNLEHTFDIGVEAYGSIDLEVSTWIEGASRINILSRVIHIPKDNIVLTLGKHKHDISKYLKFQKDKQEIER